jgi:hypothetical protein
MPNFPPERQCIARSKQTGEQCKRCSTPGRNVCIFHGGRAGRKSNPERYAAAVAKNPELDKHFKAVMSEIEELEGVDLTTAGEISLLRAFLSAAAENNEVEMKLKVDMVRDLTRALQKEREIEIARENLVPMAKVREMLKLAVSTVTRFVPASSQAECWEELSRVLQPFNEALEPERAALPESTDGP